MLPSKESLINYYVHQKLTMQEIADILKISKTKVFKLIKKYQIDIIKTPRNKLAPSKDNLTDLYNKLTMEEISKKLNVNRATVSKWLSDYNIEKQNSYEEKIAPPKEELFNLYINNNKTLQEIAILYNTNRNIVSRWFKHYQIKLNQYNQSYKCPDKEKLHQLYIDEKLSLNQIGQIFKVDRRTVGSWLKKFEIETKSKPKSFILFANCFVTDDF